MKESKTTVDWLRFRTQGEVPDGLKAVQALYGEFGRMVRLADFGRGKDGFETGATVGLPAGMEGEKPVVMPLGRVDFGGASQRGWCGGT